MNDLHRLRSVEVDGDMLGFGVGCEEESEDYLELYIVGPDESIQIRPALPQKWCDLGSYLKDIGCPPMVVDHVVQKLQLFVEYTQDFSVSASICKDWGMEIVLVSPKRKVTKLTMKFDC